MQAKKPTKTELGQAFLAELKKDSTLNASFDISLNTDALTFTSKTAGASGATITALGMKSSDTTAFTDTQLAAGKINGTKPRSVWTRCRSLISAVWALLTVARL